MSSFKKINSKLKAEINTGFGINASDYGGRFVNKNGEPNVEKRGVGFFEKISWYHTLLSLPNWKFLTIIFTFFIFINTLFAIIYYSIGVDHLAGMVYKTSFEKFEEAFFFSCQTFTTVGYGRVNPVGFIASSIASGEALIGLLSFAIATGLFYGRFSKPKAFLKFSSNALISPYKDITALMLRVAPYKNTSLIDAEAKVTLGMTIDDNGKMVNKFFQLPLEFSTVNALTLSWTIVHPINEESPFYKFTKDDFENTKGEIIVFLKAFDDMFANTVVGRTSYSFKELIFGAKFEPMFKSSGNKTILYLDKLNSFISADINVEVAQEKFIYK